MYNPSYENIESKYLKKCFFFGSEAIFMYLDLDLWLSGCCARPNTFGCERTILIPISGINQVEIHFYKSDLLLFIWLL